MLCTFHTIICSKIYMKRVLTAYFLHLTSHWSLISKMSIDQPCLYCMHPNASCFLPILQNCYGSLILRMKLHWCLDDECDDIISRLWMVSIRGEYLKRCFLIVLLLYYPIFPFFLDRASWLNVEDEIILSLQLEQCKLKEVPW